MGMPNLRIPQRRQGYETAIKMAPLAAVIVAMILGVVSFSLRINAAKSTVKKVDVWFKTAVVIASL